MSLVHMYLKRTMDTDDFVEYRVVCGDVSASGEWREVAKIGIDKHAGTYDFNPINDWLREKVLPPKLYALDQAEFKLICERDYKGYGWGAWTCRIHEWATRLIKEGNFPEQAPLPREQ